MTTYTLQGIGIDFNGALPQADAFTPSVFMDIIFTDGMPVFSYALTGGGDQFPEVDITTTAFSISIGGVVVQHPGGQDEAFVGFVDWTDENGVSRSTTILNIYVISSDIDNWFVLGGDPLPAFANVSEFNDFLDNNLTDVGGVTTGPFAPNTDIPVDGLPGVMSTENDILQGTSGNDVINGGVGNDIINGNDGDDTINPGENDSSDLLFGSTGNDEYIFTGIVGANSYYELNYSNLSAGIILTANGATNTGSVDKGVNGTDTLTDVANPLNTGWFNGGIKWVGTAFDDVFNITTGNEQWNQVSGGAGNDTFNITRTGSGVTRIDYSGAAAGINVDLSTGMVSDDGDGGVDTINGDVWEIRGSNFTDTIVGSNNDESFIGRGGSDTIDGGGGFDRLRYDRSGVDSGVNADLSTGIVTGTWFGQAFTHTISNIEWLRGSNLNDTIIGNDSGNRLQGRNGDDVITGGAGNDQIDGGDGDDTITPGENLGFDQLFGSTGNDTYVFTGVVGANSYYELNYSNLSAGIILTISGITNTGSVDKGINGTDTITDVVAPLNTGWFNGGIKWVGTAFDDVFNITTGDEQWNQVSGGAGNDTFNIGRAGTGATRIDYSGAASGINVNLSTGIVSDDGDGGVDTINGAVWEIRGTNFNDILIGASGDQSFIGRGGNDMIDGGDGFDRIRYDRSGLDGGVNVDLLAGTATGSWFGQAFTHTLSNLEWVRGTRTGNDTIMGNFDGNHLEGLGGNDVIDGGGGADIIYGGDGNDTLNGGAQSDQLFGGDGDDILNGGTGVDIIDGGDGIDTLDLSAATNAQTINLASNINIGGFANNDTFLNIENVIGSATRGDDITGSREDNEIFGMGAGDILRGFRGDDMLDGGTGNDFLFGGIGADDLDGGDGIDWAVYTDSSTGVTVDLLAGTGSDGTAEGDTLVNIERIRGSFHDDNLTGDNGSNRILGDNGADTINGLGGVDIIRGGNGNDIINGGADRDAIQGGNDNDTINGGSGTDSLLGNAGDDTFVFEAGNELDNIFDFDDAGNDMIDLSSFGFTDYTDVEAMMRQVGNHVRIDLGGTDIILLRNTDLADMGADDFIL